MTPARRSDYQSWGRTLDATHDVYKPGSADEVVRILKTRGETRALAFGCGRSYGDVALNPGGVLIDCRGLDRFLAFDRQSGLLSCEAGVQLSDILQVAARADANGQAWFLPVSPGTRFVTIGGAIANDVHGKNHHSFGTFGRHVTSIDLARSDGSIATCSPSHNCDLFKATIGGLGLTGIIVRATLQLRRVTGLDLEVEDIQFGSLAEFFALAAESDQTWEYTAAWVDCAARLGRGIFSRGRHSAGVSGRGSLGPPRVDVPWTPPFSLVNKLTLSTFNALYWRKLGGRRRLYRPYFDAMLYPLDAIGAWNRLYGRRGFHQFQCVVPPDSAGTAMDEIFAMVAASGEGSMLSVLKTFGPLDSPGLMSFPSPGTTLALDFPNRGLKTRTLLARLERIVVEAKGRLYPAKDSVMSQASFSAGFPNAEAFRRHIDPGLSSAFAKRVGLVLGIRAE